jgi:hypothetical protein
LPLLQHEFVTKSEERLDYTTREAYQGVNHIIDNNPHKTNILVSFKESGSSCIRIDAEYKIYKKDIHDDFSILKHSGLVYFDTYVPFSYKFDTYCDNYMTIQKMKIYPVGKQIKVNLIFTNNLKTDIKIDKINILTSNNNINMNCLFIDVDEILHVEPGTEYIIPILVTINSEYSGILGSLQLFWKDKGLSEFDPTLSNMTEFILPDIDTKKYEITMKYEMENIVADKSSVAFKVNIRNNSQEFRKILFLIDNSPNFVIAGNVKKKLLLYPEEDKEIIFDMIPLSFGKLKLPPFKIMEFPLVGGYENKIYSIYYLPDYLLVKGNK